MKSLVIISLFALNVVAQQVAFNRFDISEQKINEYTDTLMESNSLKSSCSSCISLLQVLKKMSYFSEPFLISTLTKVCKRTKKVDDEVVSILLYIYIYIQTDNKTLYLV